LYKGIQTIMPQVILAERDGVPLPTRTQIAPLPGYLPLPSPFAPAFAVNITTSQVINLANYRYAIPARQVKTVLRLLPPEKRYFQSRLRHEVLTAPLPYDTPEYTDTFGNVVVEAHHEVVRENLSIAVELEVETRCAYTEGGLPLPTPQPLGDREDPTLYLEFTRRTNPNNELRHLGEEIARICAPQDEPFSFYVALCERIHREMIFETGKTGVETTAVEAWNNRRGVCQDYAHIVLSVCRTQGIPARYVSGFVPGEGVMHAWTEALLPLRVPTTTGGYQEHLCWFAYDPTYNQWVNDDYVAIAVGRGYTDISPTSGTYYGGSNHLSHRNKLIRLNRKIVLL
jgi:transglutaminase-like putative cysteine protease